MTVTPCIRSCCLDAAGASGLHGILMPHASYKQLMLPTTACFLARLKVESCFSSSELLL
jgi:hypothetical protein